MNQNSPLCIGHRGAKGHLPENTLPSFELAIEMGCDWIELDVYHLDGELLVIHDDEVDRTTNGSGRLLDHSLAAARALDAGDGAAIPTLDEVLTLVDRRIGVNIELKGPDTAAPVNRLLNKYCSDGWSEDQFLISSFDHRELAKADTRYSRGALFGRIETPPWEAAEALNAWSVNFDRRTVTPELVADAHARNYRVLVYTVNELADIERLLSYGVDGLFCDFPDRMLALLGRG